jgi:hypothetical protein
MQSIDDIFTVVIDVVCFEQLCTINHVIYGWCSGVESSGDAVGNLESVIKISQTCSCSKTVDVPSKILPPSNTAVGKIIH